MSNEFHFYSQTFLQYNNLYSNMNENGQCIMMMRALIGLVPCDRDHVNAASSQRWA